MQNTFYFYDYIKDYFELVYNYYSKEYVPYPSVYFNVDIQNSIVDTEQLEFGSYQILGDKSGWKWKRIFFLPLFFIEPMLNVSYNADDRGLIQEVETSFVIPGSFGIIPKEQDIVYFPSDLNSLSNQMTPTFIVKSIEKDNISQTIFYKCNVQVLKYDTRLMSNHISLDLIFVDYIKKIFTYDLGIILLEIIDNIKDLNNLLIKKYNKNLDLFFVE